MPQLDALVGRLQELEARVVDLQNQVQWLRVELDQRQSQRQPEHWQWSNDGPEPWNATNWWSTWQDAEWQPEEWHSDRPRLPEEWP